MRVFGGVGTKLFNRFCWKGAVIAFFAVAAFDAAALFLSVLDINKGGRWEWTIAIPFWIVNFPGLPLLPFLSKTSEGAVILGIAAFAVLVSAIFWSAAAGYFFGGRDDSDSNHAREAS